MLPHAAGAQVHLHRPVAGDHHGRARIASPDHRMAQRGYPQILEGERDIGVMIHPREAVIAHHEGELIAVEPARVGVLTDDRVELTVDVEHLMVPRIPPVRHTVHTGKHREGESVWTRGEPHQLAYAVGSPGAAEEDQDQG